MGRPIVTSLTLGAAVANGISLTQAPAAAPLLLNGASVVKGVAVLDVPRRIIITSSGNDSGITFKITGTSRSEMSGAVFSETVAGTNAGIAASTQDIATDGYAVKRLRPEQSTPICRRQKWQSRPRNTNEKLVVSI